MGIWDEEGEHNQPDSELYLAVHLGWSLMGLKEGFLEEGSRRHSGFHCQWETLSEQSQMEPGVQLPGGKFQTLSVELKGNPKALNIQKHNEKEQVFLWPEAWR